MISEIEVKTMVVIGPEQAITYEAAYQRPQIFQRLMDTITQAATAITHGLVVYDNFSVYALAGNGNDPQLQEKIRVAKGDDRGANQPVGWTVPFDDRVLSTIALDGVVEDKAMRQLLSNPTKLTARLGGLSFIRAVADMDAKAALEIPDCIIPPLDGANVQIYSPDGLIATSQTIRAAQALGAEPIMTSANFSHTPESVTEVAARDFAAKAGLAEPIINMADEDKPKVPRGSYPVIKVGADHFSIIRPGCFGVSILTALLDGYPIQLATPHEERKHPNVLYFENLPKQLRGLKREELRLGILDLMQATGGDVAV